MSFNHETYLSPFTWRYGSQEMRQIWSEINKRRTWRKLWVVLAEVQAELSPENRLVSDEQITELRQFADAVDIDQALEIEAQIHHDLMAELKTYAAQAPLGGRILHLGATSMDIEDNADVLRSRQALEVVVEKMSLLMVVLADLIETYADTPLIAFTHLQPAEPSTLGYRLAMYGQDLLLDWEAIGRVRRGLRGKGFKGAVGTGASYADLFGDSRILAEFETRLAAKIGLPFYPVTTQVYPRKQDYQMICALAGLGGTIYKLGFDLRILQSPMFAELAEPFAEKQVGSSAMPFKRNPINAEKIDSLGRALAQMPRLAWDNAAHSLLERTLDDSANRRSLLPEAFLIADELLAVANRLLKGLQVHETNIAKNLSTYGPFAGLERVLMALVKAGADRQEMHEKLRLLALQAWQAVQAGKANPLIQLIQAETSLQAYLPVNVLTALMDSRAHLGDAPVRCRKLAVDLRAATEPSN